MPKHEYIDAILPEESANDLIFTSVTGFTGQAVVLSGVRWNTDTRNSIQWTAAIHLRMGLQRCLKRAESSLFWPFGDENQEPNTEAALLAKQVRGFHHTILKKPEAVSCAFIIAAVQNADSGRKRSLSIGSFHKEGSPDKLGVFTVLEQTYLQRNLQDRHNEQNTHPPVSRISTTGHGPNQQSYHLYGPSGETISARIALVPNVVDDDPTVRRILPPSSSTSASLVFRKNP